MRLLMGAGVAMAATPMVASVPVYAQEITVNPVVEARLRYEHVDESGLPDQAEALTLRTRAGVQTTSGRINATVVVQGTLAVVDDYYDGLNGSANRPLVADPQNIALYMAHVQYRTRDLTLTAGRQKITLDDERFVGNVGFRDNAQTFDAVRTEIAPVKGVKLDVSYAWSVRTIWGVDGDGPRQQAVGGDNVFANLSWASPLGTLTGFAYLVDQDEAAVQGFRQSSRTYGVRLAGSRALAPVVGLTYQFAYARQRDFHRNPNDYAADYLLTDVTFDVKGWKFNAGREVLGASSGLPFTSFQTPLGTNFKFQGWADKFLSTPANGVRDLYFGGGYSWKQVGPLSAASLQVGWHWFNSDRLNQHYGNEVDFFVSAKIRKTAVSLRYAHYDARRFGADTDKVWFQLDWAY